MGLRINTNVRSLNAQRMLAGSSRALGRVYGQLASGRRIAVAADDAAGLGIANRLRAEVRSLAVARSNVLDGAGLVDVADGALSELSDILTRTRELLMRASTGSLSDADRDTIDVERAQLAEEATRIAESTEFNGQALFGGASAPGDTSFQLQVGPDAGDTLEIASPDIIPVSSALSLLSADTRQLARRSLGLLDRATDFVSEARGYLGATRRRLDSAARSLEVQRENTSASVSRIEDLDFASASAERTRLEILQSASASVLSQANVQPNLALGLLRGAV